MGLGKFVTFEGGEGSGKSTQIQLLRDALAKRGYNVVITREPGGEPVAETIREVLLFATTPVTARAELLLFLAARAQVVERIIRPYLKRGITVFADRGIDSSVVYQGFVRGLGVDEVIRLNSFATGDLVPNLTIVLDIDPVVGLSRQSDRNRMEREGLPFHMRVREGYLELARREPTRIVVVDATPDAETVHTQVMQIVLARLRT